MKLSETEFHFRIDNNASFGDTAEVYMHGRSPDGRRAIPARAQLEQLAPDDPRLDMHMEPFIRLKHDDLQRLMDALWHAGIRPSEGQGSAGQLAAVQAHLKDMQDITQKTLAHILTKPAA